MPVNADPLELHMLSLINDERESRGLNPLALETNLNMSAEEHSQWMLDTNVFSHTGAGGSSATDRIEAELDLVDVGLLGQAAGDAPVLVLLDLVANGLEENRDDRGGLAAEGLVTHLQVAAVLFDFELQLWPQVDICILGICFCFL